MVHPRVSGQMSADLATSNAFLADLTPACGQPQFGEVATGPQHPSSLPIPCPTPPGTPEPERSFSRCAGRVPNQPLVIPCHGQPATFRCPCSTADRPARQCAGVRAGHLTSSQLATVAALTRSGALVAPRASEAGVCLTSEALPARFPTLQSPCPASDPRPLASPHNRPRCNRGCAA